MKHPTLPTLALVASLAVCHGQEAETEKPAPAKLDAASLLTTLRQSVARVEYTLKFENNSPPTQREASELLIYERPLVRMGWVVAPDTVLVGDPAVSPRFIASIEVVAVGGEKIPAREHALLVDSPMSLLKTAAPIPGAVPLVFEAPDPPPQKGLLFTFEKEETEWVFSLSKKDLSELRPVYDDRRGVVTRIWEGGLFLSDAGAPAGLLLPGSRNLEKLLALPPFDGVDRVLSEDLAALRERVAGLMHNGVHLATLNFRSPREDARERYYYWREKDEADASTVQYAVALHLAQGRALVLKPLKASQTARLESVTLSGADGKAVPATFTASLENFGAFIVEAPGLASAPLPVFDGDMRDLYWTPAELAFFNAAGSELLLRHNRARFEGFSESWKAFVTADLTHGISAAFAFTPDGRLAAFPLALRDKSDDENRSSRRTPENFEAAAFAALVANPPADECDPANVPLSERDENRIAWLGVELQGISAQLAQEMKITRLLGNEASRGSDSGNGGIITLTYPGSPAERAGLKEGDVLLRIHAMGRAKPYIVKASGGRGGTPWPSANNAVNQTLTSIGFGKAVRLECVVDGVVKEVPLVVEVSPDTYESAPQFEAEALGMHVRDLTYEARNHFRRQEGEPGVIVSRVERGQYAAVAGIREFELILTVNETPVHNVAEFEALTKDAQELQFSVRRMNRDRIVRVNLAEKIEPPKDGDDE
ncbi:MAG: hypothetical protein FWF96_01610 [Kiritimatiellaeota bacterium]|nr:hypothetical protein [Kiritimatiellota bacterium]